MTVWCHLVCFHNSSMLMMLFLDRGIRFFGLQKVLSTQGSDNYSVVKESVPNY